MRALAPNRRQRLIPAALTAAVELALVVLLWFGLAPPAINGVAAISALTAVFVSSPPKPARKRPARTHHHALSGRSSPANRRRDAAPVLAAAMPLPKPPPRPVATAPASGSVAHGGAAQVVGAGSGAGGIGSGFGSGNAGNGDGDGASDAELVGGRIKDSDYPREARQAGMQGTTATRIDVSANGRAAACRIVRSSGSRLLDETTCRLVMHRFRFQPARDASGSAISGAVDYDQLWTLSGTPDSGPIEQ